MLKNAIESVTKDSSFHLPVEPAASSLRATCELLKNHKQYRAFFNSLEREVLQQLQVCFTTSKKGVSFLTKKSKLCREYHSVQTSGKFHALWKLKLVLKNPGLTLYQEITDLLYEQMTKVSFLVYHADSGPVDQPIKYVDAKYI